MRLNRILFPFVILASTLTNAQSSVSSISFDALEKKIETEGNDSIHLINFWATWCAPCIKELPNFVAAQDSLKDQEVKYIFVSLDFPGSEERVSKFFTSKNLKGEVIMLNEPDANVWIDKLDPDWQGNIPATWFIGKDKKSSEFHIGTIETTEIIQKVNNLK